MDRVADLTGVTQALRRLEGLRSIEGCEVALAAGELHPSSLEECKLYADYCRFRGYYTLAARLWKEQFEDSQSVLPSFSYVAAESAACAAANEDLTPGERLNWRRLSFEWIGVFLDELFQAYELENPAINSVVLREFVLGIRSNLKFTTLREPPGEEATEEDRQRWDRFQRHLDERMNELGL